MDADSSTIVTTIKAPRDLWAKLREMAVADHRTANSMVLALIEKAVREQQDQAQSQR